MNALEALEEAIRFAVVRTLPRVPGVAISKLPKDLRDKLKELTSEEASKVRIK